MKNEFFSVQIGQIVQSDGKRYEITHFLSAGAVLGKDLQTHASVRLQVDSLRPVTEIGSEDANKKKRGKDKDLKDYSKEEWELAQHRYSAIKPLLTQYSSRLLAEETAKSAGVSIATIYRWRDAYLKEGHLSALVPENRGRKKGTVLLSEVQNAVVNACIDEIYLNRQRGSKQDVCDEVIKRCKTAKIVPPHPNTVRARIHALNPAEVYRRRGRPDLARNLYEPIQGEFPGADSPLAVVQVDHTEADIILVEETTRLPLGRPWLTLAIDVFSRVVVGIYVTFEHPSAVSVGMCLSNAILGKSEYLAVLDIPGEWPVWGKMGVLHVDNAKEFRGAMLKQACEEYGIDLQMRPVKVPHYGGHIERLMGTFANEIRKLPGATFSSPAKRKGYDSTANAAMTLREFEQDLVDFIVNIYHRELHSELDMPPIRKWEIGIVGDENNPGTGLPALPADPLRVQLDFLPFVPRTVQTYGLLLDEIHYYSEVLNPWINAMEPENRRIKRKFIVRRDPRDISKVYFFDPLANQYYAIPYRDPGHPPMSLWELREVRKMLKREGKSHVDEIAIFEALDRMRARVAEAKLKTKNARRQLTRNPASKDSKHTRKVPPQMDVRPVVNVQIEDDIFSEPIKPFEEATRWKP